jgi:hypothetical protein
LEKLDKIIHSKNLNSKVYVLTSSTNSGDIERAKSFKIVAGYFTKPFTEEYAKILAQA